MSWQPPMVDLAYIRARQRTGPHSIGRFLGDGRLSLDDVLRANANSSEALQEISRERVARLHEARESERRRIEDGTP